MPQTDLAILNWRREKSVFLGTNQPQEDASWIFQLRMAELERAKAGRTSEPRPWSRLGARLFDYAIWGLVLAVPLSELRAIGAVPDSDAVWLGHPLLAPMMITATWVLVEALLIASVQTTPGKWLFGCYLQFSITDAYAPRDMRSQFERALKRSFRVWWEGVGCGFALLAPILIAVAYEKLAQDQETDWDFAQDCLVTHGPPGVLNAVTGVCGLAAMLWLYGVAWHQPMADSIAWARTSITEALPSARSLLPAGFTTGNVVTAVSGGISTPAAPPPTVASTATTSSSDPVDPTIATQFADRRARVAVLKVEGPRMLQAGNEAGAASCAARGPTSISATPTRGAVSARRCRRRAITRTRSTPSARRSNSIRTTARWTRRSTARSAASWRTSSTATANNYRSQNGCAPRLLCSSGRRFAA